MSLTTRPARLTVRAAAAAAVAALLLVVSASCSGEPRGADDAKTTAVDWLVAASSRDAARYCDLDLDGQGGDKARCLETFPSSPGDFYTETPKATKAVEWTDPKGHKGIGVLVEVHLRAAPDPAEPQYNAIGVREVNGRWLVGTFANVEGNPDAEDVVVTALNREMAN